MRKFTLMELLVVMAILGILLSLLLPSLSKARQESYKAVCLSNQKQQSPAFYAYSNDNSGRVAPIWHYKLAGPWYWKQALSPYVGESDLTHHTPQLRATVEGIFTCPIDDTTKNNWYKRGGYGMNQRVDTNAEDFPGHPQKIKHLAKVLEPSIKIIAGDASNYPDLSQAQELLMPNHISSQPEALIGKRHLNGANAIYFDGHGTYKKHNSYVPMISSGNFNPYE